jgi:hypothetical protein
MLTESEFLQRERAALQRFMNKHADDDFTPRSGAVYARRYACECGFACRDPREIYRHVQTHKEERR